MTRFTCLLPLLFAPAFSATAADVREVYAYETRAVAPGVYVFSEPALHAVVSGNVVAVIGDDAVLVFDTGHHPTVSRAIADDLKKITSKPVRFVVNSHWHDDHWVGNAEFADAWPGLEVIAHPFTDGLMEARREKFRGAACRDELARDSKPYVEMKASGKRPDGTPLSEASRARIESLLSEVEVQSAECDRMRFRGVDRKVADSLKVDLGHRVVELKFLGRANTAGDLIAIVPDAKLVLTGDILVHPFPFATESYISDWAAVLDRIDRMEFSALVPGHGPVLKDRQYLELVRDLMASVATQVRAAYRPGASLETVEAAVHLEDFRRRIAGDDKLLGLNFDAMMHSAIDRAYQEASGTPKPENQG